MTHPSFKSVALLSVALLAACSSNPELHQDGTTDSDASNKNARVTVDGQSTVASVSTPENCAESESLCDGLDDDCNGQIDDVDIGGDGFCDCLRVGIVGRPGANKSETFQIWLEERGSQVDRFVGDEEKASVEALSTDDFDVVLLDWVDADYEEKHANAVAHFVESGGGVLSMTGYANNHVDAELHNQLLKSMNAGYDLDSRYFNSPSQVFYEHELTEGVDQVAFYGGLPVFGPKHGEVFAESEEGIPVGVAFEYGEGRAIVWGDEWITFDSEWSKLPGVESFWRNAMSYLGPKDSCQVPPPLVR